MARIENAKPAPPRSVEAEGRSPSEAREGLRRGSDALERFLLHVTWITGAVPVALAVKDGGSWGAAPSLGLVLVLLSTARLAHLRVAVDRSRTRSPKP